MTVCFVVVLVTCSEELEFGGAVIWMATEEVLVVAFVVSDSLPFWRLPSNSNPWSNILNCALKVTVDDHESRILADCVVSS